MATWEAATSGRTLSDGVRSRHSRIYYVDDASGSGDAITKAHALAPASVAVTYSGTAYTLDRIVPDAEPIDDDAFWRVMLDYMHADQDSNQPADVGESRLSLEISGRELTITEALEQSNYGPDVGKAINVRNGRAEGTSIIVPQATFTERHVIAAASMTQAYVNKLLDTVGTCNDDTFRGRAAEELLLLAVTGQQRGNSGAWDVDFQFALEKERTMKDANDVNRTKQGHRFAWWSYSIAEDATAKRLIPSPEGLHIAKVYETLDFETQLGIGA